MSKSKLRELIKLVFKFYTFLLIGLIIIGIVNELWLESTEAFLKGFWLIGIAIVVVELISMVTVCIIYFVKNTFGPEKTDDYEREVPKEIPPAIASILLDFYAEEEEDYLSTIASLISRGYIEIVENKEVIVKKSNLEGLLDHEILAFNIVTKKEHYNSEVFKEKVLRDAKGLGLIERANRQSMKWKYIGKCVKYVFIMFAIVFFGGFFLDDMFNVGILMIIETIFVVKFFIAIFTVYSYNSPGSDQSLKYIYSKTEKGNEYAVKIAGLRKFFQDYTLMDEKELDSVKLYDDYIPYAIALGEADAISKFIEKDDGCRRLIYR